MIDIGNRIRFHRERCRMTQNELAAILDVSAQTVFKYEQGIIENIPISKIEAMAKVFDIPPARLLGWDFSVVVEPISLSPEEEQLLIWYRNLSSEQKQLIEAMIVQSTPPAEQSKIG